MKSAPWFELPEALALKGHSTARAQSQSQSQSQSPIVIAGAGLAGCNLAFQFATRGFSVLVIDAGNDIASGASSNPAGVVKPFVTREPSDAHNFYERAFNFLVKQLASDAFRHSVPFTQCGVLQLTHKRYPDNPLYKCVNAKQASQLAGIPVTSNALWFEQAGWLNPKRYCKALLSNPLISVRLNCRVARFTHHEKHCELQLQALDKGQTISPAESLITPCFVLANGTQIAKFDQSNSIPITCAKGQLSQFESNSATPLRCVVSGKHYAIPANKHVYVGASFHRNDESLHISDKDHRANARGASTMGLANTINAQCAVAGFAGVRATTPDRLPIVGPIPNFQFYREHYATLNKGYKACQYPKADYLAHAFVLGGFGSRGIVSAAYSAELLAKYICDNITNTSTLTLRKTETDVTEATSNELFKLLHPARFLIRSLKRKQ